MSVVLYTRQFCSFCVRAKRLLDSKGVAYQEISVDGDPAKLEEMKTRSGRHTVPQIWIDQTHVGGCQELMSLESSGKLDALLQQGAPE